MNTFIEHIIHQIEKIPVAPEDIRIVLPTKRALRHFTGIFTQNHPAGILPDMITPGKLMEDVSGYSKIDPTELLLESYSIYRDLADGDPDEFTFFKEWFSPALEDFNDLDKSLVPPDELFSQLKDIYNLKKWQPDTGMPDEKDRFIPLLENIYHRLVKRLEEQGKAYQGMLYRNAAKKISSYLQNDRHYYIFAGLFSLSTSEAEVIHEILSGGKGRIFWNIPPEKSQIIQDLPYIRNWKYYAERKIENDCISSKPIPISSVQITGVPGQVNMAKYLSTQTAGNDKTALVLANQKLLPALVSALPDVESANISVGLPVFHFPLSQFLERIFDFIEKNSFPLTALSPADIYSFQDHIFIKSIYEKPLPKGKIQGKIPFEQLLASTEEFPVINELYKHLSGMEKDEPAHIAMVLQDFTASIRRYVKPLNKEILFRYNETLKDLTQFSLRYEWLSDKSTFFRLLKEQVTGHSIRLKGNKDARIHILGLHELQLLHFPKVVLCPVNEGVLPRSAFNMGYIPPDLRFFYGMNHIRARETEDRYRFTSIFHQADQVELVYNTQPDAMDGGEPSRYIQSLLWQHPGIKQNLYTTEMQMRPISPVHVPLEVSLIEKIKERFRKGLSPSAIIRYLYNPKDFYEQYILGITEPDVVSPYIPANTMGTILHNCMESLYQPYLNRIMHPADYDEMKKRIPSGVMEFYRRESGKDKPKGMDILILKVIRQYIERFLNREKEAVRKGDEIIILEMEKKYQTEFHLQSGEPVLLKGYIDRIDRYNGQIRIIDYKTGNVQPGHVKLKNPESLETFNWKLKAGIQLMIYALTYTGIDRKDIAVQAGVYSFRNMKAGFLPVITGDQSLIGVEERKVFQNTLSEFLSGMLTTDITETLRDAWGNEIVSG